MTTPLLSIDLEALSFVTGGAAARPQQRQDDDAPQPRTWGQVGREYGSACVTGAGEALIYGGMPRSLRSGAASAALGCAMGVGMKGMEDIGGLISGDRG